MDAMVATPHSVNGNPTSLKDLGFTDCGLDDKLVLVWSGSWIQLTCRAVGSSAALASTTAFTTHRPTLSSTKDAFPT